MMDETRVPTTDDSNGYDSSEFDEQNFDRPKERWAPLGAAMASPPPSDAETSHASEREYLAKLEEEQEQLNSSLLALTTHFAQVQFRLKQIVNTEDEDKEELLKELEEFAFKGIPDVRGCRTQDATILEESSEKEHESKITEQREKQQELIKQLKSQLEDLESYAYETGGAEELPTNTVLEKQKVIIDQLRHKLNLELDDFAKLSTEDLRKVVDEAIGQIINPAKVKEKLVDQLKTQIVDLERFIDFLQGESEDPGPLGSKCTCPVHSKLDESDAAADCCVPHPHRPRLKDGKESKKLRDSTLSIMKQALTLLQIFAVSQFGCGGREFRKNLLKRTPKGNHWGDLRARLEVAIDKVIEYSKNQDHPNDSDYTSDSEDTAPPAPNVPCTTLVRKSWPPLLPGEQMPMSINPVEQSWPSLDNENENRQYPGNFSYEVQDGLDSTPVIQCNQALTTAVRKELTMALRDLLQHGLMEVGQSSSLVPWGCFPTRSHAAAQSTMMHAWDLIIKFYEMKHGKEYNDSPARKLSMSFDLNMVGGKAITNKQTLLSAIDTVLASHQPLKRSEDAMLKAFVCFALNQKKLVSWLRLILRTNSLVEFYYQPWSYVMKTGFDDALRSLDKLTKIDFNLPVDLAVRQIHNIKDAF